MRSWRSGSTFSNYNTQRQNPHHQSISAGSTQSVGSGESQNRVGYNVGFGARNTGELSSQIANGVDTNQLVEDGSGDFNKSKLDVVLINEGLHLTYVSGAFTSLVIGM